MSVFTRVECDQLESFLKSYSQGTLIDYAGINAGIENTNYFVTTTQGQFVLTLFETLKSTDLPYFLNLMAFFAEHDVPSAHPIADNHGSYIRILNDKPAALVKRLQGKSIEKPTSDHCRIVGTALGNMHNVGRLFKENRGNDRGPLWWREKEKRLLPVLDKEDADLIRSEIDYQTSNRLLNLSRGVIHGDLFRDNVLFIDHALTGIIDFYYACNDILLYDVAVSVNDWCSYDDGSINETMTSIFLAAYHQAGLPTEVEDEAWVVLLRAAALRFFLSRLQDQHFPRQGEITHTKDPLVFKRILLHRIGHQKLLRDIWRDSRG
jgi:homoserine kinase type II